MTDTTGIDYTTAREAVAAGGDPHEAARALVASMTEDERLQCLDGDAPFWAGITYLGKGGYHKSVFAAARVPRLGFPGFAFSDGPRGVVIDQATCFPVCMARGASWDLDLEERIGDAIGRELRAVGADLFGGVCINVLRHPAWGRAQETFGEDPHHVGELGAALTRGVQRHAMACVKHFACNSMENARFTVDITVDEVALHEVYLPHFKRVIDEGVAVVMSAYNSVNGEMCGDSPTLLNDVLRAEWDFDGFVISDWIMGLRDAAQSLEAGLDVEMPYRMVRANHLREALDAGEASWADVDRSAERIVATVLRFDAILQAPRPSRDILASSAHRALAREAAAKSVVLLRNEPVDGAPVLPLDASSLSSVALIGELGAAINLGDGGSSDVWAPEVVTILDGLTAALPDVTVTFDDGADVAAAASATTGTDVAIVVVGYTHLDEGEFIGDTSHLNYLFPGPDDEADAAAYDAEVAGDANIQAPDHIQARGDAGFSKGGDRQSLRLKDHDVALIRAVASANPRTVVAIVAGSAVVMSEWDTSVPTIVQSWYAGSEGGHGLADVLLGDVAPRGRLPFTVPVDESHLPAFDRDAVEFTYDRWHGWWHLEREGHAAAYPFGFGLTYTTFALEDGDASATPAAIDVTARVRNTGARDGSDVLQVYARREGSNNPSRLIGFHRVEVAADEVAKVAFTAPLSGLAERDVETHTMIVVPGSYEVRIARDSAEPGIVAKVHVAGDAS